MNNRFFVIFTAILVIVLILTGCGTAVQDEDATLYQVSTLQALIAGQYGGEITAAQLAKYGDTGLGTFDDLDGEMIVLDGKVYKARVDGTVSVVPDDEKIPFANVAMLHDTQSVPMSFNGGYNSLKAVLDKTFPQENKPVLFCIKGMFTNIEYRSVPEQQKPYSPLTEVVKEQTVFNLSNVQGILVGFRFPGYLSDMNATGYHLHFISKDKNHAGHLLEAASGDLSVKATTLDALYVVFPDNISDIDLTADEDDVEAVEKK